MTWMSAIVSPTLPWIGDVPDSCTTSDVAPVARSPSCPTTTEATTETSRDTEALVVRMDLMWLSKDREEIPAAQPLEDELHVWWSGTHHVIGVPQNWTWDEVCRGLRTVALRQAG